MNQMLKPRFRRVLSVGMSILCLFWIVYSQRMNDSVVRGTISDIQGAVVPNATVTFENEFKAYRAVTSQTGEYSIALPPAIYNVSVDATRLGFERLRRSRIRVDPSATRILNAQVPGK